MQPQGCKEEEGEEEGEGVVRSLQAQIRYPWSRTTGCWKIWRLWRMVVVVVMMVMMVVVVMVVVGVEVGVEF